MLPSTKIYKLDLQWITDNALNKKLWGKSWIIFEYDKIKIELRLSSINIIHNKLFLDISLKSKDHGSFTGYNQIVIPLNREQQNMDNALRQVYSTIRMRIAAYEKTIASGYKGFERAVDLEDARRDAIIREAKRLLDELEIQHYDIRSAYINSCLDNNPSNYADEFLDNSVYITRPHYYLMLCTYFFPEDKDKYEEVLLETGVEAKSKAHEKYKQEMSEYIEAIYNNDVDEYIANMEFEMGSIQ